MTPNSLNLTVFGFFFVFLFFHFFSIPSLWFRHFWCLLELLLTHSFSYFSLSFCRFSFPLSTFRLFFAKRKLTNTSSTSLSVSCFFTTLSCYSFFILFKLFPARWILKCCSMLDISWYKLLLL